MSISSATQNRTARSLALQLQDADGHGFMTTRIDDADRLVITAARELGVESRIVLNAAGIHVIVYLAADADAIIARAGVLILDALLNG